METKNNVVSDKAEKDFAQKLIKNEGNQMTNAKGKGKSIDGFPMLPTGSTIFLEYNLKDVGTLIGIDTKDQKTKNAYFTVIGIGATVTTVDLGDRLILKPTATVETYVSDNIEGMQEFRYHVIYEHAILGILK